ncbi:MAG: hypothetical protein O7C75_05235, partial [Verrucomicrobia bacterium]|nr:hypothetical protein [Verrucomicrobiota bacterium]
DLAYSQALKAFGYLNGVGVQTRDAPRYNLVGDPYFTDGLRAVMFFDERPFTFAELDIKAHWEIPSEIRAKIGEDKL